jgi:murein DD-endopeptidase MepM/ murein hydrolase activator NlpD
LQKASLDARDAIRHLVQDQWRALRRLAVLPEWFPGARREAVICARRLTLQLGELRLRVAFRLHHLWAAISGQCHPADLPLPVRAASPRPPSLVERLAALSADRRAVPVALLSLVVVASLLAQAPSPAVGGADAYGGTEGIGQAVNPRIAGVNLDAVGSLPARESPAGQIPAEEFAPVVLGQDGVTQDGVTMSIADVSGAGEATSPGTEGSAGPGASAQTGGETAAGARQTGVPWSIDGSLVAPVAIDMNIPDIQDQIRVYTVRKGDTLTAIASRFKLNMMTIWWANNLKSKDGLKVGQKLVIPPVDGVLYTVKDGDTVMAVAKRYHADPEDIIAFNDIRGDTLVIGQQIMVPDGRGKPIPTPTPTPQPARPPVSQPGGGGVAKPCTNCTFGGWMLWPVAGGHISQYFHYGHPAIDIAAPTGTPVRAAAAGVVIFAGWRNNGGGYQVWISHGSNVYTTYNHMSAVSVGAGQRVERGQQVGRVGATGRAYGSHLHFEVWIGPVWAGGYRVNPLSYSSP